MIEPWKDEPNELKFEWEGLPCVILRHPTLLYLCGYVGIPPEHKLFGKGYDEASSGSNDVGAVHGGLTYADKGLPNKDHPDLWWFGFDCAHAGDFSPGMLKYGIHHLDDTYRDIDFVRKECERLVKQLREAQ